MAEIQHSIIPDELLHEAKHAINAGANTFLRAKGDGTTEFVPLTTESMAAPTLIRDDSILSSGVPITLQLGKVYNIMLVKTSSQGVSTYKNDLIDLRGMNVIPTGAASMLSVGGTVLYANGALGVTDSAWKFFRVVEVQ